MLSSTPAARPLLCSCAPSRHHDRLVCRKFHFRIAGLFAVDSYLSRESWAVVKNTSSLAVNPDVREIGILEDRCKRLDGNGRGAIIRIFRHSVLNSLRLGLVFDLLYCVQLQLGAVIFWLVVHEPRWTGSACIREWSTQAWRGRSLVLSLLMQNRRAGSISATSSAYWTHHSRKIWMVWGSRELFPFFLD